MLMFVYLLSHTHYIGTTSILRRNRRNSHSLTQTLNERIAHVVDLLKEAIELRGHFELLRLMLPNSFCEIIPSEWLSMYQLLVSARPEGFGEERSRSVTEHIFSK